MNARRARTLGARMAWGVAGGAGIVCVGLFVLLMVLFVADKQRNPLSAAAPQGELATAREQLAERPTDETLKRQTRRVDADIRGSFWWRRDTLATAAWLLVAAAGAMILATKAARWLDRREPDLDELKTPARPEGPWAQVAVGGISAAFVVLMGVGAIAGLALEGFAPKNVPDVPTAGGVAVAVTLPPATPEEMAQHWPVFRGWPGGVVTGDFPDRWDGEKGEGVRWTVRVPLEGKNSPVVWHDKVFLTGASDAKRELYAFAASDGQLLWTGEVGKNAGPPPTVMEDTGFAASTVATDGARVYAIFATGDIAAFTLDGKKLWERRLGEPKSQYGYASSLTTFAGRVIVQWDIGDEDEGLAKLIALDGATGKTAWETKRPVGSSWSSPLIAPVGNTWQLILNGRPWVIGYDPQTGAELWRANLMHGDVAPSPAVARGIVYVTQESALTAAIKAENAAGDITETAVLWKNEDEGMPDTVSPAADGQFVWTVTSNGTLYCFDAATGKKLWDHEFDSPIHASPLVVQPTAGEKRLWLIDTKGVLHVLAVGAQFKELSTAPLGESVSATPALVAGRAYIRAAKQLYCLGAP